MTSREEDLQEFFHKLESEAPGRDFTMLNLRVNTVKWEIDMYRQVGTVGSSWGTPAVVKAFLGVLSRDHDPKMRSHAAKHLGSIGRDISRYRISSIMDTVDLIENGLIAALDDKDRKVQRAAVRGLRHLGTPRALNALPPKPWWKFW